LFVQVQPACLLHHALNIQVRIEIENLMDGIGLSESLTRAAFEELNKELFRKTVTPLEQVSTAPV
jgi:molecular chaperone DnaK (HSP70)